MTEQSRRLVLAQRPSGMVDDTIVRLETVAVPEPGPGEAVVQVTHLSIDPTIRTWMDDAPGYLPPIEIDAVIRSGGLGTVVASQNDHFPVGATIFGCSAGRTTPSSTRPPVPGRWSLTAWTRPPCSACSGSPG